MAIRNVIFNVSQNGVTPTNYQWGGIQYEDNATEVCFTLEDQYLDLLNEGSGKIYYRIDFNSAFAGYHPSENLLLDEFTVKRQIPKSITSYGGECTSTLNIYRVLEDKSEEVILTMPVTLFFTGVPKQDQRVIDNLSAFEENILKKTSEAKDYADKAKESLNELEEKIANGEFNEGKYVLTEEDKAEITNDVLTVANIESVPNYVLEEAKAVSDKVIANRGANSLVLLMGADFHVSTNDASRTAIKHMGQAINEIRNYITPDAVVLLGDYNYAQTPMNKEQGIEDMKLCRKYVSEATKGITTLWLNGNHDYYTVSNDTPVHRISDDMVYALVGSNTTNTVVDTQNVGRNYGYVDFEKQKTRLIYLNTTDINGIDYTSHSISDVQIEWLKGIALDLSNKEDEQNWDVIICAHIPLFDNTVVANILGNFVDKTNDFTDVKANLIGVFHGHIHNFKVTEKETNGGNLIKYICIPNAVPNRENPYTTKDYQELNENGNPVAYPKTADTAEDTSFNAVIIDKDNKAIHAICYGAGYDRVINYDITEEPEAEIINLIPLSIDATGAIYGDDYDGDGVNDGYKQNVRIGSDGLDITGASTDATGFIHITVGDKLYFSGCEILQTGTGIDDNNVIVCYDTNKTRLGAVYLCQDISKYYTFAKDENNHLTMIDTMGMKTETTYIRIVGNYIGADSIITINQEIRE